MDNMHAAMLQLPFEEMATIDSVLTSEINMLPTVLNRGLVGSRR